MLLIIGWRGSPNQPDEPQHKAKGKITKNLLQLLKIKYCVLKRRRIKIRKIIKNVFAKKKHNSLLSKKNTLKTKKKG